MKIKELKYYEVDAGWRPWLFVKIITDEGLIGWSECTESNGIPKGIVGVLDNLSSYIIGKNPLQINKLIIELSYLTRQSQGSVVSKAISSIENALIDIKAKYLNVPVYELFGGSIRDEINLYWSHFGTTRVRAHEITKTKAIKSNTDLDSILKDFRESKFKCLKTNFAIFDKSPEIYMPGFSKTKSDLSLTADKKILNNATKWISSIRNAVGPEIGIAVDFNFNFDRLSAINLANKLADLNPAWLEIDSYSSNILKSIKDEIHIPITSGENLNGAYQYKPFFETNAMDISSIDVIWNGFNESLRIANLAKLFGINVCPHNYNGHLSTFISMHFCSIVPNFQIAEIDIDDVPWRDDLFTNIPKIEDGKFIMPKDPGWGTEPIDSALLKYKI